nr:RALF-like protein 33 [Medicago sativa]
MRTENNLCVFFLFFSILALHVSLSSSSTLDFTDNQLSSFFLPSDSGCRGSIAECSLLAGDEDETEFMMDSESNRRILAARRYISYGALRRNTVPCSRRGASYYNCRPGAQANPYRRGCSAITRCRR